MFECTDVQIEKRQISEDICLFLSQLAGIQTPSKHLSHVLSRAI